MKLKLAIFAAFVAVPLTAQPVLKLSAPAFAAPGTTVTASIQLTGSTGNIVAIQDTATFSPVFPATFYPDISISDKTQVCAVSNGTTCILFGVVPAAVLNNGTYMIAPGAVFNSTPIPDGATIQHIQFTVPQTAAIGSTIQLGVSNTFASEAGGMPVAIAGSSATVTVATPLSLVQSALNVWATDPTLNNLLSLMSAQIAAQQQLGKK